MIAAVIAAAAGLGTCAALAALPAGLAAGQPLTLLGLVASSGWFWSVAAVAAALLAPVAGFVLRRDSGRRYAGALEPALWGAAAPLASLALDPWFFHRTAAVTAAAGLGIGVLVALMRLDEPPPVPAARKVLPALLVLAVLVPTFLALPGPPWFHPVSGDEPHYLVIARSLWIDGDVDVRNEYEEGLTMPFWPGELSPHAKPGADSDERYSIHGSGLAVWLAPWYGAGRGLTEEGFNVLIRFAMSLWLAAAAAALFVLLRDLVSETAAVAGTAVAVFTLPLIFAGPHLFPAVPVFALSCGAYAILRRAPGPAGALGAGVLLACLPWLHFKFFGVVVAIAAAGVWTIWHDRPAAERLRICGALALPVVATAIGHVAFTWRLYRRVSPLAVHVGGDPTLRATSEGDNLAAYVSDPVGAATTAIGYLMDQREGLLFYAPHYLLAVAGLAWLWHRRRHDALALALVFAALVGPYALAQETGHWAPPARPLTGVLWTLAVPLGVALMLPAGGRAGRAAVRAVLVTAGALSTVALLLQADLLYHDYNVAWSLSLLRYGAPGLSINEWAPLWLGPESVRWAVSLGWLALATALAAYLWRWGSEAAVARQVEPDVEAAARRAGLRAAVAWVALAATVMLAHHALVPLTNLHEPWRFDGVGFWKPHSPPTRAWAAEQGVWTGGYDDVSLLLSSRQPLQRVVLELTTLAPMQTEVQLGRDRQAIALVPGERGFVRLSPGPATRWGDEYFYHLNVVARGGASPAALGLGDDGRGLGVLVQVLEAR